MGRFCYCSKVLPGKVDLVRAHWRQKGKIHTAETEDAEEDFWNHLTMTGFDSWLQFTKLGDFIIHCLEGESLEKIFKGLREQIKERHPIAIQLRDFYLTVLGKDYSLSEAEPTLQHLLSISLPTTGPLEKRAHFLPLLPEKVTDHIRFKKEAMQAKRERHEESMRAFGVSHLSSWLQTTPYGHFLITYNEREPLSLDHAHHASRSPGWKEISTELMDHTGLSITELHPDVELLTNCESL